MTELPSGTITFLFTDIEGSTPLWEKMPEVMAEAIHLHHSILRKAIEVNGGVVFNVVGDGFLAAFRIASQAVAAAISIQHNLQDAIWPAVCGPLKVRIGLHTGVAEVDASGEYKVSHTLNRVARIMSAGYGGQILLSREVRDLVEHNLPPQVSLRDMGEHRMKGMEIPEHLYQIIDPGLRVDFPPLATAIEHPHNLPVELTSFIGRENEIAELKDRVINGTQRLLTLTGAGGAGKTRLSLQLGRIVLGYFKDGVWLVDLSPLDDPLLVAPTIAGCLGLREVPGMLIEETLVGYLQKRCLLLILDNCEHLLQECSRLADLLLRCCLQLMLVATSREIFHLAGEVSYRVPSLSLPPEALLTSSAQPHNPERLQAYEAVQLFLERARQAVPNYTLDQSNAPAVISICRWLDGMPLAIELAAARLRLFSAQQIATRLDNVFRLLTGGSRNVLPRQQTLKAAIDWGYALLTDQERLLLQRLSVFAGSWELEGAESVCAGEGIDPSEVLDLLAGLVDKSFVQPYQPESSPVEHSDRFRFLETVRRYLRERLTEAGGGDAVRDRHLAFYLQLGEQASEEITGPQQLAWVSQLENELENLRLALEWSLEGHIEDGLRLAAALMWFWHFHDRDAEGAGWLRKLLETEAVRRGSQPLAEYGLPRLLPLIKARNAACFEAEYTSKFCSTGQARVMLEQTTALCRLLGEPASRELAMALMLQAYYRPTQENDLAVCEYEESLAICRRRQHRFDEALCLSLMGSHYWNFPQKSVELLSGSLEILEGMGITDLAASVQADLALLLYRQGNYERSRKLFAVALDYYRKLENMGGWSYYSFWQYYCYPEPQNAGPAYEALSYIRDHERVDNPFSMLLLAEVEWSLENYQRAEDLAREVLVTSPKEIQAYLILANSALDQGNLDLAGQYWKEAISLWMGYSDEKANVQKTLLVSLAKFLTVRGQMASAAQVLGAVDEIYQELAPGATQRERHDHDAALAAARDVLGEEAFSQAWQAGKGSDHHELMNMLREADIYGQ